MESDQPAYRLHLLICGTHGLLAPSGRYLPTTSRSGRPRPRRPRSGISNLPGPLEQREMAPRPPPAIMNDLIIDILLRLPPDDIACLVRASLVCKAWRRLLSDRVFLSQYREIHGAAPVLGLRFLYNNYNSTGFGTQLSSSPTPTSVSSLTNCRTLDCRHGRVLLHHRGDNTSSFTVWDPVSGKQLCFSAPADPLVEFMAAVLCPSDGCDHVACSTGPFLVVLVEKTYRVDGLPWPQAMAQVSLYSSETGKWSLSASIDFKSFKRSRPSLLAGDTLFFLVELWSGSWRILKFNLARGVLSVIKLPLFHLRANMNLCTAEHGGLGVAAVEGCSLCPLYGPPGHHMENMILCTAKDGGLGVATVNGCSLLRLLSGRTDPDGRMRWVQDRAIELAPMIPTGVGGASTKLCVVGFAEGTSYIFVRANDSIFCVELNSGKINKISSGKFGRFVCRMISRGNFHTIVFPFVQFYIPDSSSTRLQCKCQ